MSEVLSEFEAMKTVYTTLGSLQPSARQRVMQWLVGALGMADELPATSVTPEISLNGSGPVPQETPTVQDTIPTTDVSPKAFMALKDPQKTVERMSCLAYYLTHYRNTPHFSNADIEKLNREAAGPSINAYRDLDSTSRSGYLASAENRKRQITSRGDELVNALPDREAVKALYAKRGPQRKRRASTKKREANGDSE